MKRFKQARETRIIAGAIAFLLSAGFLFFCLLAAAESFSQHPIVISLFLLAASCMILVSCYFIFCIPVLEIDPNKQQVNLAKSCIFYNRRRTIPFNMFKEVGLKELYQSGTHGDQSGYSYYVELRGSSNIEVPGSQSTNMMDAIMIAKDIAEISKIPFNTNVRKVFTGSIKLK